MSRIVAARNAVRAALVACVEALDPPNNEEEREAQELAREALAQLDDAT